MANDQKSQRPAKWRHIAYIAGDVLQALLVASELPLRDIGRVLKLISRVFGEFAFEHIEPVQIDPFVQSLVSFKKRL